MRAKFDSETIIFNMFFALITLISNMLIVVTGVNKSNIIKKETLAQVLSVNLVKLLRTPFLQNTFGGCFCKSDKFWKQWRVEHLHEELNI